MKLFISESEIVSGEFFAGTFSTDTPSLKSSEMEDVQEVNPALGHDEPVSVGCPLYNEASAAIGCMALSSNVVAQRLDEYQKIFFYKNCHLLTTKIKELVKTKEEKRYKSLICDRFLTFERRLERHRQPIVSQIAYYYRDKP